MKKYLVFGFDCVFTYNIATSAALAVNWFVNDVARPEWFDFPD